MSLLLDARVAMPAGGMIRIETASTADRPAGVRLIVQDDGRGMVPSAHDRPIGATDRDGKGLGWSFARAPAAARHGSSCCRAGTGR